jgi:hypothetical protein
MANLAMLFHMYTNHVYSIIYGELGRYPLEIEIKARMVTYWSRLFSSEVETESGLVQNN